MYGVVLYILGCENTICAIISSSVISAEITHASPDARTQTDRQTDRHTFREECIIILGTALTCSSDSRGILGNANVTYLVMMPVHA